MLSFFLRGVLDEILNLIESVSEGFPSYSSIVNDLISSYFFLLYLLCLRYLPYSSISLNLSNSSSFYFILSLFELFANT